MKKILLIITIGIIFITGCESNNLNEISFADLKLENQIRNEINKKSGKITSKDLDEITSLELAEDVTSLRGLRNANNLSELVIANVSEKFNFNTLIDLKSINTLIIKEVKVNKFNFLTLLGELENLTINNCDFERIGDLRRLEKLVNLNLSNNKVISLRYINNLVNLESIDLIGNDLKDIEDLSKLEHLKEVTLDANVIDTNQVIVNYLTDRGVKVTGK